MTLAARHHDLAVQRLGLDARADAEAADVLATLLRGRARGAEAIVHRAIAGRPVTVLGPRPGDAPPGGEPVIVAGSAVNVAVEQGLSPVAIVTDLDGDVGALISLAYDGAIVAVHAHGDNVAALRDVVPQLPDPILGTCQSPPPEGSPLIARGGFTDGDRACFLAASWGASAVRLVGFDWDDPRPPTDVKRAKLALAREMLSDLSVPLTGQGAEAVVSARTHSS